MDGLVGLTKEARSRKRGGVGVGVGQCLEVCFEPLDIGEQFEEPERSDEATLKKLNSRDLLLR